MFVKLEPNCKNPERGKPWQLSIVPWEGFNNGRILDGLTVVDFDVIEAARVFWEQYRNLCQYAVRSPKGVHLYFEGETKARKFPEGDIKSGKGHYCLFPPSSIHGKKYELIRQGKMPPVAEVDRLFPIAVKEAIRRDVKDVRKYLTQVMSIQGQKGSHGLVRAAAICRDGGMTEAEAAVVLLTEWNREPNVSPIWPAEEIARAVSRVFQKGK